jgi:hypothetical protein
MDASLEGQDGSTTETEVTETPNTEENNAEGSVTEDTSAGASGTEGELDADGKPIVAEWSPNFKFKYSEEGKKEQLEKEIDDLFKPLIKDANSEKTVKELFEKAHGLDLVKATNVKYKTQLDQIGDRWMKEVQPVMQGVQKLDAAVAKNDIRTVCDILGIDKKSVYKFVADELRYEEMSPADRKAVEAQRQAQTRAEQADNQNQDLVRQYQSTQVALRTLEMNQALNAPELSQIVKQFESACGPGSFKTEVIRAGQLAIATQKKDITVQEAINEVVKLYKPLLSGMAKTPPPGAGNPKAPAQKNVLPKIAGQNSSPARKEVSSLAELRELAKAANSVSLA